MEEDHVDARASLLIESFVSLLFSQATAETTIPSLLLMETIRLLVLRNVQEIPPNSVVSSSPELSLSFQWSSSLLSFPLLGKQVGATP